MTLADAGRFLIFALGVFAVTMAFIGFFWIPDAEERILNLERKVVELSEKLKGV